MAAALRRSGGIAAQHAERAAHDERRGDQCVPDGHQPPLARQSTGGVSNVISMPNPIVTADVPSGSIRPVSSKRPERPRASMAIDRRGADHDREQRRPRSGGERSCEGVDRVDAESQAGPDLASRRAIAMPPASSRRRRGTSAPRARPAAPDRRARSGDRGGHEPSLAARRGRRSSRRYAGARSAGVPALRPRCPSDHHAEHEQLQHAPARPRRRCRRAAWRAATPRPRSSPCRHRRAPARRRTR